MGPSTFQVNLFTLPSLLLMTWANDEREKSGTHLGQKRVKNEKMK